MNGPTKIAERLRHDGFIIVPGVLDRDEVEGWVAMVERGLSLVESVPGVLQREREVYGVRNLMTVLPEIQRLAHDPRLRRLVTSVLGDGAIPVRALYFDKTPTANWNLPWHQDVTIAVRERREVPGYGPWTRKGGVDHVHAPALLLERMVTIRLHLDDCGPGNGPMRVIPGSHRAGRLSPAQLNAWIEREARRAVSCLVPSGGAVLMRPLIVHASAAATSPGHRRVIHIEYAAESLPGGLEWAVREPSKLEPASLAGWERKGLGDGAIRGAGHD
jgi:hypothetical protein